MSHVLVVYASKHGATADIATAIADTLNENGIRATCAETAAVRDVAPYDAVILGSAVYTHRWRAEARRFLRDHADELSKRPLWVFSSGPVGDPLKDNPGWAEPKHTIAKAVELGARDHAVFGGALTADQPGMLRRSMAKNTPPEFQDRRDWEAIRSWTEKIASELQVAA